MLSANMIRIALVTLIVIAATCIPAMVGATVIGFESPTYQVGSPLPAGWTFTQGWPQPYVSTAGATQGSQSLAFGPAASAKYWFDMATVGQQTVSLDIRPNAWSPVGTGWNYAQYSVVGLLDNNGSVRGEVTFELYDFHRAGHTQPNDMIVWFSPGGTDRVVVGNFTLGTPYTISFTQNYAANTRQMSLSPLGGGAPLFSKTYNVACHIGGIGIIGSTYIIPEGTTYIDNLRIGEVPEPSSLIALGALVTPLLALRRRKA